MDHGPVWPAVPAGMVAGAGRGGVLAVTGPVAVTGMGGVPAGGKDNTVPAGTVREEGA